MKNPRLISTVGPDNHWEYEIPTFKVSNGGIEDGEGTTIKLCRGNKDNESTPRQEGVFTETLLEVCRTYLNSVNTGELASRETALAITKIDEALMWLNKRAEDRKIRGVQGSYKK